MNVEYINPFLISLQHVISTLFGVQPKLGKVYLKDSTFQDYTVNIQVNGQINGSFALVLNDSMAKNLASHMIGQKVSEMNDISVSAIGELGNMIMGNTSSLYAQKGLHTNISTPLVIKGETDMFKDSKVICVPVTLSDFGNFNAAVSIS